MRCSAPLVSLVALIQFPNSSAFLISQHYSHYLIPTLRSTARQQATMRKCSSGAAAVAILHKSQSSDRFPRDRLRNRSSDVGRASMSSAGADGADPAASVPSRSGDADIFIQVTAARNVQSSGSVDKVDAGATAAMGDDSAVLVGPARELLGGMAWTDKRREGAMSSTSSAPARTEIPTDVAVVGAPQQVVEKEYSIEAILKELAEIQNQGPKNYCVLGTRHCSFLHQQIIELLAYALVLSGNHVFTSGAMGTNAATIRGALRAERKELLTVVLPQSLEKQSEGSRELIQKVTNVITNPQNDHLPLDAASRLCNSDLLKRTEQLICFAFHDSHTIIETSKEARSANMIVTELYLD